MHRSILAKLVLALTIATLVGAPASARDRCRCGGGDYDNFAGHPPPPAYGYYAPPAYNPYYPAASSWLRLPASWV